MTKGIVVGRVANVKFSTSKRGTPYVYFSIAVGTRKPVYIPIVAFNNIDRFRYVKKGMVISVEGRLEPTGNTLRMVAERIELVVPAQSQNNQASKTQRKAKYVEAEDDEIVLEDEDLLEEEPF